MHSSEITITHDYNRKSPYTITCHHNGDFSGNIIIDFPDSSFIDGERTVELPFELMEELVGRYLQNERISLMESQHGSEYLRSLI